jgi:hypothetical protein
MKRIVLALCIVFISSASMAQKNTATSSDSSFFEIGLNTVSLFRAFQSDATAPAFVNPFQLTVDKSFGKLGLRLGVGYESRQSTEQPSQVNSNTEFIRDTIRTHFRVGLGYYKNLHPKWSIRTGVDLRIHNSIERDNTFFVSETGVEVETLLEKSIRQRGVSPFFFLQYHLGNRVSVATELSFLFSTATITEENKSILEDFSTIRTTEEQRNRLEAPTALYLIVRF